MPQARIIYGGLQGIRGLVYSMTRGVLPSAFTLFVLPQDNFDPGIQTLSFGVDSNLINLSGCAVANNFIRKHWDGQHPLWAVTGFDRRWKWRLSTISGDYNRRKPDGTIDPSTQKYPSELANLLGTALGESIDYSRMSSSVFPRAKWNNQRADLALQALCDQVCCEVVLNPVSDSVEIWPLGTGQNSATGTSEVLPKYRFVPRANIPSRIECHGGDSLYQHRLKLQSVIDNTTGQQTKLQDNGFAVWSTESPFSYPSITDTTRRALAFDQAHREFRVVGQADGSVQVPGCPVAVSLIDQYQLNNYRIDSETDLEGYNRKLDYYVDGDYWAYTDLPNNTSQMIYTGSSSLNTERRLVKFPYPLFKLTSSGAYDYAQLYLTTSYKVLDFTNRSAVHVMRSGGVAGSGGTLIVRRPEVFATYATASNTEAQANTELDAYVSLYQQRFISSTASEITYAGFVRGSLDGVLAQATWMIHPAIGTVTTVCENEELDTGAVDRNERARRMALDRLVEAYS